MALARVKTWVKETLTFQDLNAEFNNILNNATSLISPMTGSLDLDGNSLVLDSDGDTAIVNSTGNTVQFQVGGAVSYIMTTTALDLTGKQLVFDDDNDTYLSAAVDDTLVFTIGGATTYTASATIFDFNALRLDLDADNDTSVRASTDDTIVLEVGGSDIYTITATTFDFNGTELILDADGDSSLTVDTDDVAHLKLQGIDAFIFDGDVASPVNGLTFTATATGVGVPIAAQGTDTNIDLLLVPKGSGVVDLNGVELVLDTDADSSLTVDTDDVLHMKLQGIDAFIFDGNVASPVNGLTFTSSATGTDPDITAQGSDTNIGINLVPKGSGTVQTGGNNVHHVGEDFTSTAQTLSGSGEAISVAHGLSARPTLCWATLVCTTTEHGYAVGEEVYASWNNSTSAANGMVVSSTATNVIANVAAGGAFVVSKTSDDTAAITEANWELYLHARL